MRKSHGGYSRAARKRRRRARELSQQMRHGDSAAAFSLLPTSPGVAGKSPSEVTAVDSSVRMLFGLRSTGSSSGSGSGRNRGWRRFRSGGGENRIWAATTTEIGRSGSLRSAALGLRGHIRPRAKQLRPCKCGMAQGGASKDYQFGDDECRPVRPGGSCPVCKWRWGSREPHVIAVL